MNTNYNNLERLTARCLTYLPVVKFLSKYIYTRVMYLINRNDINYLSTTKVVRFCNDDRESFFGYYDKSPISQDGYILVHLSTRPTYKKPSAYEPITVALFSPGNTDKPILEISTSSYNWQQGARAHWLNDDLFIFNDFDSSQKRIIARVFSKSSLKEVKRFDWPVQDSFKEHYFLSINYRRLLTLRPDYGYRNLPPLSRKELSDISNDGIWKINYLNGENKLLYSFEKICSVAFRNDFKKALHKVNHVMISPSGKNFIFLHRYYLKNRRFDRLLLGRSSEGDLKLLSDNGMVSHCFWVDDNKIIGYLRGPDNKDAYFIIDIKTGVFKRCDDSINVYGDGHPHINGDHLALDTYPDKARIQHLLLNNFEKNEIRELGKFFHSFKYHGESRCDLHPRFSPNGESIYFDSVFDGFRRLYKVDIATLRR